MKKTKLVISSLMMSSILCFATSCGEVNDLPSYNSSDNSINSSINSSNSSTSSSINSSSSIDSTSSVEKETKHTVMFNSNGGTKIDLQTVLDNNYILEPIAPIREGYIFDGWYYNNQKWDFNTKVTHDIILTAHWTKKIEIMQPDDVNVLSYESIMDKDITIDLWYGFGKDAENALKNEMIEFNAIYPNIHVNMESKGGSNGLHKATTMALEYNQNIPDVVLSYADHTADYLCRNALLPLNNYMNSKDPMVGVGENAINANDDFLEQFYKPSKEMCDNIIFSLPFAKSSNVAYYNKTIFDEFNIQVPKTIQDYEVIGEQIINAINPHIGSIYTCKNPNNTDKYGAPLKLDFTKLKDKHISPIIIDSSYDGFVKMTKDFGGSFIDPSTTYKNPKYTFNSLETEQALDFYRNLKFENVIDICDSWEEKYPSRMFQNYETFFFEDGLSSSKFNVPYQYDFEVGVAPLPYSVVNNTTYKNASSYGHDICVLNKNNDEERLASWLLTRFLTCYTNNENGYDPNLNFCLNNTYLPVKASSYTNSDYLQFINQNKNYDYQKIKVIADSYKAVAQYKEWDYYYKPTYINQNCLEIARSIIPGALLTKKPVHEILEDAEHQIV